MPKSPELNNTEGDSGIDANSQGSAASNEKDDKTTGKKKKNKKTKNKEKNCERNSEEKENNNVSANRGESKEKSPGEEEERPDSRAERCSQPRVPCTIEGHSLIPEVEKPKPEPAFIEAPRKGRNRVLRQSEGTDSKEGVGAKGALQPAGKGAGKGAGPGKGAAPDAGWKEVVRKSKKVSVPSNAISRVIGRGGSNINAIRELSGAHIEVEKQSKGQGDRTILIKGSAEATRLANQWITAIIASPEKDLAEIVGRQQYKTLSSVNLTKGASQ